MARLTGKLSAGVIKVQMLEIVFISVVLFAIMYLLAIMPKVNKRPKAAEFQNWLYAHRGLHDNATEAPENSMKAFARAMEAGYGIELDIQLSKDGVPVVFHDYTLQRVCGVPGRVSDYTCEELKRFSLYGTDERIPKFSEVLALVDGKVPLIVELKIERLDVALCPAADGLLQQYKGMYCVESFNPLGIFWYRRNRGNIVRGQLSDAFLREGEYVGGLPFVLQNLLFNFLTKPDFVAYHHKYPNMLSRRLCRGLYRNMAAAWTIRSQAELEAAKRNFDIFIFDSFVPRRSV